MLTGLSRRNSGINDFETEKSGVNGVEPEKICRLTGKIAALQR